MATRSNQNLATPNERPAASHLPTFRIHGGSTTFREALAIVAPGASGAELVKIFGGEVSRVTVMRWRNGTRQAPQWARDIVRKLHAERAAVIAALPDAPARPNNAQALRRINAQRAAEKQNASR